MEADHLAGGVGLIQQAQNLLLLRFRADAEGPLLGFSADRLLRQQLQYPWQFQRADGFMK